VYPEAWRLDSLTMPPSRGRQTSSSDVIFCALQVNVRHARRIARRCGAPILLHVETWLDSTLTARRQYLGIQALRPIVASARRVWYRRQVKAVAFSNPQEIPDLQASAGTHYLAATPTLVRVADTKKRGACARHCGARGLPASMEGCRAPGKVRRAPAARRSGEQTPYPRLWYTSGVRSL
jgi:hypothetical protein